jgi:putative phosphoesterase
VSSETIAVVADVHGNTWALDAVLEDARAQGVDRFVDLGDCVAGPLEPARTADRLMSLGALTVRGNNDRAVVDGDTAPSAAVARSELDERHLEWLAALPATAWVAGQVFACHGTPDDDTTYLLEEVTACGIRRRSPRDVEALLGSAADGAQVILCGHTHLARVLPLSRGAQVVNPGSVGLPAYDDDLPHPHVMESGSPHARYVLLRARDGRWSAEFRTLAYAWDEAAAAARARGREDWAVALETGLALPTLTQPGSRSIT